MGVLRAGAVGDLEVPLLQVQTLGLLLEVVDQRQHGSFPPHGLLLPVAGPGETPVDRRLT